jgi:hypothetical protein
MLPGDLQHDGIGGGDARHLNQLRRGHELHEQLLARFRRGRRHIQRERGSESPADERQCARDADQWFSTNPGHWLELAKHRQLLPRHWQKARSFPIGGTPAARACSPRGHARLAVVTGRSVWQSNRAASASTNRASSSVIWGENAGGNARVALLDSGEDLGDVAHSAEDNRPEGGGRDR